VAMSERDVQRIRVLSEVLGGRRTVSSAATLLNVTPRQARRLLGRLRDGGSGAIGHRLRGRPSNRPIIPELRDHAVALVRERYSDFGPSLAAEKLAEVHGLKGSAETLRKWMIEACLWLSRKQRRTFHQPRRRRESLGELIQIDGSEHRWFENRAVPCTLLVFIDDATGGGVRQGAAREPGGGGGEQTAWRGADVHQGPTGGTAPGAEGEKRERGGRLCAAGPEISPEILASARGGANSPHDASSIGPRPQGRRLRRPASRRWAFTPASKERTAPGAVRRADPPLGTVSPGHFYFGRRADISIWLQHRRDQRPMRNLNYVIPSIIRPRRLAYCAMAKARLPPKPAERQPTVNETEMVMRFFGDP
jgi:Helix-turn-helix domain